MILLIVISLQFSTVQTYITKKVAAYLSKELDADITLDRVYFKPFSALELNNFKIKDKNGKILIATEELQSSFSLTQLLNNKLVIDKIRLHNSEVNFEVYKDSTNFKNIVRYFTPKSKDKKTDKKKLELDLGRIELTNNRFRLINHEITHEEGQVDFSNLDLTEISGTFDDIKIDSVMQVNIHDFTVKDKSGLFIKKLTTQATYSHRMMEFKQLYLATNRSIIQDYLRFDYKKIEDFGDFLHKVKVTTTFKDSYVNSHDIELFAPSMKEVVFDTHIKHGNLQGTVDHIIGKNILFTTASNTTLKGDLSIKGLPDIEKTIFDLKLEQLTTTPKDVETLVPKFANMRSFELPKEVHKFEKVDFAGRFYGYYNDFNVDGNFQTALGTLSTKSQIGIKGDLTYEGHVQSIGFNVGKLIETTTVEDTDLQLTFAGKGLALDELELNVDGYLANSKVRSYKYDLIQLKGAIANQVLDFDGSILDKNLDMDYKASIDWKEGSPNYQLDADISYAQLNRLKLVDKDSIVIDNARIKTNLIGSTLNNITGYLEADSVTMVTTKGKFQIDGIHFKAEGDQQNRSLVLNSDVVDAKMYGNIDLNTITAYFRSLAMRYAPAISIETKPYNPQNFDLDLTIKSFKPVAALLDPMLSLDDGAHLSASFSTDRYTANFVAYSPTVEYKGIRLTNLSIQENADNRAFSLDIDADRINFGDSTYINNISLRNVLANDSLNFNVEMSNENAPNYLNLMGNIHFAHNAPAYIKFAPSKIIINRDHWNLNDDARMRVSKGKIYINHLVLSQALQQIKLDGILSNENDKLNIAFDNFSLTSLNGITNPLGIQLTGLMNGSLELSSIFQKPFASARIKASPITYNKIPVGQLNLMADIDPSSGLAHIDFNLIDDQQRGLKLAGKYNFFDDNEPLDIKGKLTETDLALFQPFLIDLVSNLKGKGNGEVAIKGTFKNPKISGLGRFNNTEFTVNYLKTKYSVDNQSALVENNAILLQNLTIRDAKDHIATANGIINLNSLANPYIDVDVAGNNFMILNTTYKDNNLYYGTAYATGVFKFKGYTSAIDIDISAESEKNTVITIPFNSAMTVSDSDFIYFISKDSTENRKQERKSLFQGLSLNMNLKITPDAEVNLATNLGTLRGNGKGEITMRSSSLGDFEMFGDFIVSSGKFHFTAQDFINKYFDIKEGGTIRWTGNPSDAVININAMYQQRTSVRPLYNAAGRADEDERVLAQADMFIKGTIEQPDITFDINFPQNPYIKDQLQSYLSDVNNVNQQALSLIMRRSFTPSSTSELGREVNNTLLSAGTEIAFNQLNNIISQSLNINFFDLNIRSLNDASASVRLLNDRLILTGGITDRTNFQATDLTFFREGVTTDAELTFRLRKDGNLMLRAYNRPYTRNFLLRMNDAEYISALGLIYRQEFDSIREFWQNIWKWKGKDNRKK